MSTQLVVPKAGFAMVEAELVKWLVVDGATVSPGEIVCLLESDKSAIEIEASVAGRITLLAKAGDICTVGAVIGEIS